MKKRTRRDHDENRGWNSLGTRDASGTMVRTTAPMMGPREPVAAAGRRIYEVMDAGDRPELVGLSTAQMVGVEAPARPMKKEPRRNVVSLVLDDVLCPRSPKCL